MPIYEIYFLRDELIKLSWGDTYLDNHVDYIIFSLNLINHDIIEMKALLQSIAGLYENKINGSIDILNDTATDIRLKKEMLENHIKEHINSLKSWLWAIDQIDEKIENLLNDHLIKFKIVSEHKLKNEFPNNFNKVDIKGYMEKIDEEHFKEMKELKGNIHNYYKNEINNN